MTTRRGGPAPITVTIAAIAAVRITVTILVRARRTSTAVTITTVAKVPVVTITEITAVPTIVRITVGRTAVSHILARGGSVRPISYGIVDADPTAIQVLRCQNEIQKKNRKLGSSKARTMPFNSVIHFVASSTVLIRIKPKPRDLSD
jgi:hypothetical protein